MHPSYYSGIASVGWITLGIIILISWGMRVAPWQLLYLHKLPPIPIEDQVPSVPPMPRVVQKCTFEGCTHWASGLTYARDGINTHEHWMNHWLDRHSTLAPQSPYTDEFR